MAFSINANLQKHSTRLNKYDATKNPKFFLEVQIYRLTLKNKVLLK
ncbi:hypothetical protein N824_18980 [Pedobacter sp. V48]|nr:hypothetical protein N824_18980 [Pedobacter sp. V48]